MAPRRGWSPQKFSRIECPDLWKKLNTALAKGDLTALRALSTETAFSALKHSVKDIKPGITVDWKLQGEPECTVLAMFYVQINEIKEDFAQVTVEVNSKQALAVRDAKGKVLGGDPDTYRDVREYMVFERSLTRKDSVWRYAGKLDYATTILPQQKAIAQ